jgi:hypothetical protein
MAEISFNFLTTARASPEAFMFLDRADAIPDGRFARNSACEVYNRVNQGSMAVSEKTGIHAVNISGFDGISGARKQSPSVRQICGRVTVCR